MPIKLNEFEALVQNKGPFSMADAMLYAQTFQQNVLIIGD